MLNSKCTKIVWMVWLLIVGAASASIVMAAENGALNYPAGSPGIFVGRFPPIPGLFVIAQTSHMTSDALYDDNGDKEEGEDFEMEAWAQTFRFLASYPRKLWGASLYSQLVVPIVNVSTSLSANTPGGKINIFDDDDTGIGNITISPLVLNWHRPENDHHYTVGVDFVLEQGAAYDESNDVNAGTGYATIIPTAAYRFDRPDGPDLGIRANLMINLQNDATHYDTGDMLAFDFVAGWNFGNWKAGIVGGYTHQYGDDEAGKDYPHPANGKLRTLTMGPSIAFSNGPLTININYQKGVLAENASMNDAFWLNLALPLYVPPSARPKN